MKKIIMAVTMAAASAPLFAQETSGGTAEQIIDGAQTALTNMLDTAGEAVVVVVLAGLAIWGGIRLVGLLKSAFNAGKGR